MIYLDNAATSFRRPASVIEAVAAAMNHTGNAGRGVHQAALGASRLLYETREKTATFFGLDRPNGVSFTANATQALNIAVKGILTPGDHVVTTVLEHNSVLRPLYEMEKRGVRLTIIPSDSNGCLDYCTLERALDERPRMFIGTHASNLTGNLVDIGRIGRLCRERGILFVLDASQTAGVFPISMKEQSVDIVCFTGHKGLMGPQGTGGLCVREGISIRPLISGGTGIHSYEKEQPKRMPEALEAGTQNIHGLAGLSAAFDFLMETGIDTIRERETAWMIQFYSAVRSIPGVQIYGDYSVPARAPIVALNIRDCDSSEISDALSTDYGIATRPGAHCAPLMHRALGTEGQGAVRFSFSYYNTEDEIEKAVQAVRELAAI